MKDDPDLKLEVEKQSREYAWQWFQYHAGQRQAVFRFFLTLIGAVLAGYFAKGYANSKWPPAWVFGAIIILSSFLFWRLDCRGARLVKIGEAYLKIAEARLANLIGTEEIKLAATADNDNGNHKRLMWVHSFSQIYRYIFILIAVLGVLIIL